jgi:hypothetical protein
MIEVIDVYLQQLREIQEDAVRLQARAVISAGELEGEAINVILHHLDRAIRTLEDYQACPRPTGLQRRRETDPA